MLILIVINICLGYLFYVFWSETKNQPWLIRHFAYLGIAWIGFLFMLLMFMLAATGETEPNEFSFNASIQQVSTLVFLIVINCITILYTFIRSNSKKHNVIEQNN